MCLAMCAASMRVRFGTCCTRGSVTGTVLQKNKYTGSSKKKLKTKGHRIRKLF